jgi:ferredoxin-2, mitochondrial
MLLRRVLQSTFRAIANRSAPRNFSYTPSRFGGEYEWKDPKSEDEIVNITYVTRDGTEKKIKGKVGDNVMYLAHRYIFEVEIYIVIYSFFQIRYRSGRRV